MTPKTSVKAFFSAALLFIFFFSSAQKFTWKKGSFTTNQFGVYGTLGVPNNVNTPGSRAGASTWTDLSGNFWLYGGYGYDAFGNTGNLGDLWRYTPLTNIWTWMKGDSMVNKPAVYGSVGIGAAANTPGNRYFGTAWTDASGNLWLYGDGNHSDVWKYTIASGNWTWMAGSSAQNMPPIFGVQGTPSPFNTPGPKTLPAACSDASGDLWIFGGSFGNDLWRFSTTALQWTWVAGTNSTNSAGTYGTLGVPSTTAVPGMRNASCLWIDAGNIWIFGGNGFASTTSSIQTYYLNDSWRYNIASGQWTWMKGSSIGDQYASPGPPEIFAASNVPGARVESLYWKDSQGKFWISSGIGYEATTSGYLNDLWKYDPTTNQWAWMQGSLLAGQNGIYGTLGVPSVNNMPGSRIETQGWMDANNDIWIFGGLGYPQSGMPNLLNDLWKYTNCSSQALSIASTPTALCIGSTATVSASGALNYTWTAIQTGSSIIVSPTTTTLYYVTGTYSNGCERYQSLSLVVNPNPSISVVPSSTSICIGEAISISANFAQSYTFNTTTFTSSLIISPTTTGPYVVSGKDSNGCSGQTSFQMLVNSCTAIEEKSAGIATARIYPNPNSGRFTVELNEDAELTILSSDGKVLYAQRCEAGTREIKLNTLPQGLYFVKIARQEQTLLVKMMIE